MTKKEFTTCPNCGYYEEIPIVLTEIREDGNYPWFICKCGSDNIETEYERKSDDGIYEYYCKCNSCKSIWRHWIDYFIKCSTVNFKIIYDSDIYD